MFTYSTPVALRAEIAAVVEAYNLALIHSQTITPIIIIAEHQVYTDQDFNSSRIGNFYVSNRQIQTDHSPGLSYSCRIPFLLFVVILATHNAHEMAGLNF